MKLPPELWFWGRNFKIFLFSLQYKHLFPWIRVKEAFSRFGNARNRFFAWFYPYIVYLAKKFFSEISPRFLPPPLRKFPFCYLGIYLFVSIGWPRILFFSTTRKKFSKKLVFAVVAFSRNFYLLTLQSFKKCT
jgi:hypothetical protein